MPDASSAPREDTEALAEDSLAAAVRTAKRGCRSPVAVLTTCDQDRPVGCAVSAFLSLSLRPPSLLVSLRPDSITLKHIRTSVRFGLSVLGEQHGELVTRFSRGRSDERFDGMAFLVTHGVPLLVGVPAAFACQVTAEFPIHDRVLLVGGIVAVRGQSGEHIAPVVTDRDALRDPVRSRP